MNIKAQASRQRQRRDGYTLVDMMIVILIMGILGSVGLNQYNKY
ncbi:MAG: prepilin-type N-terminal cleavage/methylation domain-containing protein, partial [Deltaproteobacteria bacterium]|nr:prepilin-type N-terminal cleavage/methylation domain-containing protein [Deltaproteobacteria bacterium]